ncbi:hypothetical protein LTS08_006027 [Lithohypha guttulata]|uniref:uncharacterized protein n=1 Tax=Lithohypha guttulata TaxID=1690604 RepID=UPI002DDDBFAA|nr:hypothetical protein LTR51_002541 [Lithohypha guttulata]KAK5099445.1 hypothetical protein LTS08_006027 [Lithohypha guttulata]
MTSHTELGSSPGSDSSQGIIFTPAGSVSPLPTNPAFHSQPGIALQSLSKKKEETHWPRPGAQQNYSDTKDEAGYESDAGDMSGGPPLHRPTGGFSNTSAPLLKEDKMPRGRRDSYEREHERSVGSRKPTRNTFRSRSPKQARPEDQARKKYLYASFFLVLSLISFVIQTETAVYIQHKLHWNKAYCMLWLTHGSWSLLWPTQLLILRLQKRRQSWHSFWLSHRSLLTSTAQMVQTQDLHPSKLSAPRPWKHMFQVTAFVTTFLTVAGGSWYVAVDLTTPSDLTAIYNCSAFFAYAFSILLLKEKARLDKIISVALAILGVLIVAYGDSGHPKHGSHSGGATNPQPDEPDNRTLGNLIIGIGSVMYGLYEVLYKKYACPPEGTSPTQGMLFANTFGSMIGIFTLFVLWIPLPILHYTGIETFALPTGKAAALLAVSTLSNAIFSGSFLVLMSLTSPVLSSVAALLTIFLVAITDYLLTGEPLSGATISGGILIVVAFGLLSWATYREMMQEEKKRVEEEGKNFDEVEAMLDDDEALDEDSFEEDSLGRKGKRRVSD